MSHVSGLHDGDVSTAFRQEKADVGEDRAAPGVHAIRHEEPLSKSWPGMQAMLESPTKACQNSQRYLYRARCAGACRPRMMTRRDDLVLRMLSLRCVAQSSGRTGGEVRAVRSGHQDGTAPA